MKNTDSNVQVILSNKAIPKRSHTKINGGKKKIIPKRRRKKVKVRKTIPVRKSSDNISRY